MPPRWEFRSTINGRILFQATRIRFFESSVRTQFDFLVNLLILTRSMGRSRPKNSCWRSFEIQMDSRSQWYSRTRWTNSRCTKCDWLRVNPLLRRYTISSIRRTHWVISEQSLSTQVHFHLERSFDSSPKIVATGFSGKRSDAENFGRSNLTRQCTEQHIENFIPSFDISSRMSV
jgi:hypothetical protein